MSDNTMKTYSDWKTRFATQAPDTGRPATFTAATIETDAAAPVTDRQDRVKGFDQTAFGEAAVLLVGAGGLGSEISHGLVRKGIGTLVICDEDVVEAHNLPRQKFVADDIGENKAVALARNLVAEGTTGTQLEATPQQFQDAIARGFDFDVGVVVCAPDNDAARVSVAEQYYGEIPVVITGLDQEANGGYVFVGDQTGPCFRCYRPDATGGSSCAATPAVIDAAKLAAGLVLYAVDSVLMSRHRAWNLTEFYLSGDLSPDAQTVAQRADCRLCGGAA